MSFSETITTSNEEKYLYTIKDIRSRNFSRNIPFLILSDNLPEGQVYREYPDGHIELQEVFSVGIHFKYKALKTLISSEAESIRKTHGLL